MSLTFCNIHFSQKPNKVVYLSQPLIKQFKLTGKKSIQLKLGKEVITAIVRPLKKTGNHLYLSSGVRQSIRIPKSGSVYVTTSGEDELQLGPLIGVLTDSGPGATPFGTRTGFIKQLLKLGEKRAFFFAFTPRDINWQNETVNGHFLNSQGGWYRKVVPLPDVVYNRLPSRKAETTSPIQSLRERFIRKNIPFFNWSFFNKSDVYKLLEGDTEAEQHMPESVNNPTPEKIKELLEKHQFVYYKPTAGSWAMASIV